MHEYALDIETEMCMRIASHLTLAQIHTWPQVRHLIRERCEQFRSGRTQAPRWFRKRLHELDRLLEVRWDYLGQQWIIERYSRADRAFVTVMQLQGHLDQEVINTLQEGDTWRFPSPEAYLAYKREKSARIRAQRQKEGDEKVLAAVDSLSKKRAEEFLEVENALRTGETVIVHGDDEKAFDHMQTGAEKARAETIN
jgi:hypothetical protein